ncbi:hypothetical protein [uncultured Amphritea sp.]|mgnify:CR=1 FL=1|uniref:hypothetical protein n=1 Tax=uncultured Amphritea sp. TaxID=981605 RepID=UPI00261D5570|nr:hypothetical protein [uncultured Amphritea sp.]
MAITRTVPLLVTDTGWVEGITVATDDFMVQNPSSGILYWRLSPTDPGAAVEDGNFAYPGGMIGRSDAINEPIQQGKVWFRGSVPMSIYITDPE